jgi:hypothetical protein
LAGEAQAELFGRDRTKPDVKEREAGRPAGAPINEISACHQPSNGAGARHLRFHLAMLAVADEVIEKDFCCTAYVCCWHDSEALGCAN